MDGPVPIDQRSRSALSGRGVPHRVRPFSKTQAKTPAWQRLLIGRDLAPTRAEYEVIVEALWDGDAPMDDLVDWMFSFGFHRARGLFEQALARGIDDVTDAPAPLRRFFAIVDALPPWIDRAAMRDGARFVHGIGLAGPMILRDVALMGGYLLSGFNHALVATGALGSDTSRRIAETGRWWVDCTDVDGLGRFAPGFATTLRVRFVHALVRRGLSEGERWDHEQWGLPLNQVDMTATYLGFCVVLLGGVRKLGLPVTARESNGVMQLFRYACWLMGVEERWLVADERSGLVRLHHAVLTQGRPDWTSRELAVALSQEPLRRTFGSFERLRRRLDYARHLSTSRYFLGEEHMAVLGLPQTSSWYPLLTMVPRLVAYASQRFVPPLRPGAERRGRRAQLAALDSLLGRRPDAIIEPGASHPAHVPRGEVDA
jgi:hypothetical protein